MGLEVTVYKNLSNLSKVSFLSKIKYDKKTGEVLNPEELNLTSESIIAINQPLGNISLIEFLRNELESHSKKLHSNLLISRILYSGSHSGDYIDAADLEILGKELESIKKRKTSAELRRFIHDLEKVILIAKRESNPIVFT